MKSLLKYVSLWLPFAYATAISGVALSAWSQSAIASPPGYPALIAFLPMAFFFSALVTQNHIAKLERQIASVEQPMIAAK